MLVYGNHNSLAMTLGIEFPPRKLNVDMENPKVHAGTARLAYRVLTRSPTEPDAIGTGRPWQAATYQYARLSIYSTKARWTVRATENRKPTALQAVIREEPNRLGYVNVNSKPVSAVSAI